jgi:hypothetical protein
VRTLISIAVTLAACDGGSFHTGGGSGQSSRLALANGHAYWFSGGDLLRTPLDQLDASTLVAHTTAADGNVHVNSQYAYWREKAEIHRVPLDASTEPVVIGASTAGVPANLALDETNLYYPRAMSVVRQSVATGAESIILTDRAANSLALAGDTLVGTSCQDGIDATWRVSVEGGAATRIAELGCGELAAVDDSFVYTFDIVNQRPGIVRVPITGGRPVVLYETTSNQFAVAAGFVYAISLDNEVVRVPASGGAPTMLASEGTPLALAVDGATLYVVVRVDEGLLLRALPLPE